MTFVVAPNTSGLTPLYPYESSPSQKLYPKSLKNQTPQKRLSRNRTAKVIPFYYTTKLFTNFFRKKYTNHNQHYDIHDIESIYFFFYDIEYPIILPYYIAATLLLSGKQQCRGACKLPLASEFVFEKSEIRLSDILRQVSKEDKRRHLSIGQLRNIFYFYVLSFDGGWRVVFYQRQEKIV